MGEFVNSHRNDGKESSFGLRTRSQYNEDRQRRLEPLSSRDREEREGGAGGGDAAACSGAASHGPSRPRPWLRAATLWLAFIQFIRLTAQSSESHCSRNQFSLAVCIAAVLVREVVGRRHERRMQTPSLITWLLV